MKNQLLDIRPLKQFSIKKLPRNMLLRNLIIEEKDEMHPEEFLYKSEIWMKLLETELSK